jgi:hypothetical protein
MNGNIKSANIYYSDDVTYTGVAGTETNPFCVEDFWDMTNLNEYATFTNTHFRLVNTIDFDDYPEFFEGFINRNLPKKNSAGVISYVGSVSGDIYKTTKSVVFDGYNNTFRNIVLYGIYYSSAGEYGPAIFGFGINDGGSIIKNLRVVNFICSSNSGLFSGSGSSLTFIGCDFGIYKLNNNSFWLNNICFSTSTLSQNRALFERCTINFKGNTLIRTNLLQSYGNNHVYKYCHINLDVFRWTNSFMTLSSSGLYQFTYITGRIRNYGQLCFSNDTLTAGWPDKTFIVNNALNSILMSYINLRLETSSKLNYGGGLALIWSVPTAPMTPFIINITKLSNNNTIPIIASMDGGAAIKKLTDEQLKDIDYLLSLGFSVSEEVGG